MSPIQQMLLGVGAVATKTYVDDVFSTEAWIGAGSPKTITNGIDFAGKGGMVWTKSRSDGNYNHVLSDTVRGGLKALFSNTNGAEDVSGSGTNYVGSFNNNGVQLGTWGIVGGHSVASGKEFATWSFRKAPGFFDVVTWTGDGSSNRQISHSLSSIPGLIIVKKTSETDNWNVYHRSAHATSPENYRVFLNTTAAAGANDSAWNQTKPTSSNFTVGINDQVNGNGKSYVAYVFAGGKSDAATARSVDFDGVGNWDRRLGIADSSDFTVGTNFTAECWYNCRSTPNTNTHHIMGQWDGNSGSESKNSWSLQHYNNQLRFYWVSGGSLYFKSMGNVSKKIWHHFAFVKSGSTTKLFIDGKQSIADFDTGSIQDGTGKFTIGGLDGGGGDFDGKVSNVRIVNGTAVYTNTFRPLVEPLTNITNTKLLCCNNSSITGSTVTPGTITAYNSPTASTDSPFDDPAGFVFGENEDQNVIKCGSYEGNGSSTGPEIFLGWEPSFLILKNSSASENWFMYDSMRGIAASGDDKQLFPNLNNAEGTTDHLELTSTGFKIVGSDANINGNGNTIIYCAVRRPDGYVGKPPELGTDVFAMDTGNSSSTIPAFDSGFPVDFALNRQPATSESWYAGARLIQGKFLMTNGNNAQGSAPNYLFSDNNGWRKDSWINTDYQSWMWKRHAGFDVVTWTGNETAGRQIEHSLNAVPEMMWVKNRGGQQSWAVYHKGLNGGTNPEQYRLLLNVNSAESDDNTVWDDTAPTSSEFTIGDSHKVSENGYWHMGMLFASVDGISKVGSYTGNESSSGPTVTLGFAPRLIILKSTAGASDWYVLDTLRGLASGDDKRLSLNDSSSQDTGDYIDPSSTGFQIVTSWDQFNKNNTTFIYYAHA